MQKRVSIVAILAMITLCADDKITLHNKTPDIVYARVYCVPAITGNQVEGGTLYQLPPRSSVEVIRPEKQATCTRNLAFSFLASDLSAKKTKKEFEKLPSIGIGLTSAQRVFDNFFIMKNRFGVLKGYNTVTWQPYQLLDDYEQNLLKSSVLLKYNKHKNEVARVRIGLDVSKEERDAVQLRLQKVQKVLGTFLQKPLNGKFVPKIAFINSGGGIRSTLSCLGWHMGAQKIGLLDAVTYDIGLSGGAWFVLSWLVSGKPIEEFKNFIKPIMQRPLYNPSDATTLFNATIIRDALGQPLTAVNPWSVFLAHRFFASYGDAWQATFFSEQTQKVENGNVPFPICAAVNGYAVDLNKQRQRMEWFQWTPYEASGVGSWLGNAHVPMWGFGRKYQMNVSVDDTPEYDVGLLMGICGSAFALSYARVYEDMITAAITSIPALGSAIDKASTFFVDKLLPEDVKNILQKKRFSVGKAANFAKDVPGSTVKQEELRLIDGAIAFNLPTPPAMQRKVDVLILCDAAGQEIGPELQWTEKYAREHGFAYPKIHTKDLHKKGVTIFMPEKNSGAPLVMYLPAVDPSGKVATDFFVAQFEYNGAEFDRLTTVMEQNVTDNAQEIKQALTNFIMMHNGFD